MNVKIIGEVLKEYYPTIKFDLRERDTDSAIITAIIDNNQISEQSICGLILLKNDYLYIDFSILNNVIRDIETYELINRFNEVTPIFKAVISQDENGNDFINLRVEKKYVNADKEALCTISYAIEELQKASFVEFLNSLKK